VAAKRNGRVSPADAARRAVEQLGELTGRPVEGVLALRRSEDGWAVTVELLELHRIPETTDVLASYDVALDAGGELCEYRRTRRYVRGRAEEDE
jgi:Gas vesicle synthesis protein GvpO